MEGDIDVLLLSSASGCCFFLYTWCIHSEWRDLMDVVALLVRKG